MIVNVAEKEPISKFLVGFKSKLEGAVMSYPKLIHSKIKDITWLCPRQKEDGMLLLENETSSLSPFSEEFLSFLNDLSQLLRSS